MSQELISKKDLLELTGISYGQLYRWKRKNLIPEDWFVRKSTFTGQETFFPKERMLERIDKIQALKDQLSLDELANMFSPAVAQLSLGPANVVERKVASQAVVRFYEETIGTAPSNQAFNFRSILTLYILEQLLGSGEIHAEEGKMIIHLLEEHYEQVKQKDSELILTRKLGISSCFLVASKEELYMEKGTKVVVQLSLASCIEELKPKLL